MTTACRFCLSPLDAILFGLAFDWIPVPLIKSIRRRKPSVLRWCAIALSACTQSFVPFSAVSCPASEGGLICWSRSSRFVISWKSFNVSHKPQFASRGSIESSGFCSTDSGPAVLGRWWSSSRIPWCDGTARALDSSGRGSRGHAREAGPQFRRTLRPWSAECLERTLFGAHRGSMVSFLNLGSESARLPSRNT